MSNIQIRLPTPSEQTSQPFIQHVAKLINEAYAETDSKLYKPGKLRTNSAEVSNWLASKQFYFAFSPEADHPIGSVRVHKVDSSVTDVGVLTVHKDARSLGLGRRLMSHAEEVAVSQGDKTMRLELLFPKPPQTHEFKGFLRRWYESLGYETVGKASAADVVPHIAGSFEDGSEFLIMEKALRK